MKKKILAMFLAAMMVVSIIPFGTLPVSAAGYTCGTCNGSGYSGTYTGYGSCGNCSGKGYIPSYGGSIYFCEECKEEVSTYIPSGGSTVNKDRRCSQCGWTWVHLGRTCSRCDGSGETYGTQNRKCTTCNGSGKVDNCNHAGMKSCDASCKTCGFTQIPQHKYINECDAYCANCYAYRTVEHKYEEIGRIPATCAGVGTIEYKCTKCGFEYREMLLKTEHEYSNSCDDECNNCGKVRSASHSYSSSCDRYCNTCDDVRDANSDHVYDSDNDEYCDFCGEYGEIYEDDDDYYYEEECSHRYLYSCKTTPATQSKNGKFAKKCIDCGDISPFYTIYAATTIKLSKTKFTYDGKTKKPTVIIKDSDGNKLHNYDYKILGAKSAKKIGRYKITVKLRNNYKGTKTLYYTINPKKTTGLKVKAGKKQMTVSWKKDSKVSGYQVLYATNKKFTKGKKTVNIKSYKTAKKLVKKLKSKKTYYVKVRSYKTVDGKKLYSDYTSIKKIKVK